ncbi:MAG: gamma-glutamylcyclotransferase [Acidobacteria bacterium]|nr:gamma-glutamylcyclotransferase [Acidobacteriota bacterium]
MLRRFGVQRRLGIQAQLRLLGPCLLHGRLYDLGRYPALRLGEGRVRGELYELLDPRLLAFLDRFEDYDPAQPSRSQYRRERVRLIEPARWAWVYVYNQSFAGRPWVRSGSWADWRPEAPGPSQGLRQ